MRLQIPPGTALLGMHGKGCEHPKVAVLPAQEGNGGTKRAAVAAFQFNGCGSSALCMQGSPTRVVRVFAPEHKETRRFLEGSAQAMAEAMLGILKEEKIV